MSNPCTQDCPRREKPGMKDVVDEICDICRDYSFADCDNCEREDIAMAQITDQKECKARKPHICNYCGGTIRTGEKYHREKLKHEGRVYGRDAHPECVWVANELRDYIDPWEGGISEEEFQNACTDVCQTFICPDCEKYNERECEDDKSYCIKKICDLFKTHELHRVNMDIGYIEWGIVKREKEECKNQR